MVLEKPIEPFWVWLGHAGPIWLLVLVGLLVLFTGIGWVAVALQRGPFAAMQLTARTLLTCLFELGSISLRRAGAVALLAIKESIRRKVLLVVFALFVLILAFSAWFLGGTDHPARTYIGNVFGWTTLLVWLLAVFLSAFSLPNDIRHRTIFTIVTKPVRRSELVLGRMLGFAAVGTVMLLVMGLVSYFFVQRGLSHTHQVDVAQLRSADHPGEWVGRTSKVQDHWHEVRVYEKGEVVVGSQCDHWHALDLGGNVASLGTTAPKSGKQESRIVQTGNVEGLLVARVPVWGTIRFLDRTGQPAQKGINVGDEWLYRSYIEGGSLATAIWTFEGLTPDRFPNGLPVEMTIGVFRTHKGTITKGVTGSLQLRNPDTDLKVEARIFESKEFQANRVDIPLKLTTPTGDELDLFRDLVTRDGRLEIWLQCVDPAQYFGAAQPDLYLRARDASFTLNFLKGYVGLWMQMLLIVGFGVMFSTFLSGPVALIATIGTLAAGYSSEFVIKLGTGQLEGGGPIEASWRMVKQENLVSDLSSGVLLTVVQMVDSVLQWGLAGVGLLLPSFDPEVGRFEFAKFVADGFDVPWNLVAQSTLTTFGFMLPLFVIAYLFLSLREVGK